MIPGFLYVNNHKKRKIKLNFQHNRLSTINLTGELCKIGKDKVFPTLEDIILNWLICVSINNLHNYFIGEVFKTIHLVEYV